MDSFSLGLGTCELLFCFSDPKPRVAQPRHSFDRRPGLTRSFSNSIRAQLDNPNDEPTLTQITLGGAGTGILASLIATPTELIKIRQQANMSTGAQPTAWVVARDLWRGHGVRGLYRGITSTALRDTSYG